jgi:hypothetical protein
MALDAMRTAVRLGTVSAAVILAAEVLSADDESDVTHDVKAAG